MMCGYDLKLIELSKLYTTVPIIACGGAKCREDFGKVVSVGRQLHQREVFSFIRLRISQC